MHFTQSYNTFTTIGSYNSPRLRNKILRSTSVISQDYSSWVKLLPETFSLATSSWTIYCIHFVILLSKVRVELPFEDRVVGNSKKRTQVKWTLVKAWVQFIEESCIYLFTISYLATTKLRPQFRRTTAPFITNEDSKLPNQTIVASRLSASPHV